MGMIRGAAAAGSLLSHQPGPPVPIGTWSRMWHLHGTN